MPYLKTCQPFSGKNTGLTDVNVPLTCQVGYRAFSGCKNLKNLTMPTWGTTLNDLPVVENINIYYFATAGDLNIYNCFIDNPGNLKIYGDVSVLRVRNMPNLNRLSVFGKITGTCDIDPYTVPKEFEVRTLDDYMGWRFYSSDNVAYTPGYCREPHPMVDF